MTINTARALLRKPIENMTLEELQRHKVRLLDAERESLAKYGFARAVHDGFYKIVSDPGASCYFPSDLWLSHNLRDKIDLVISLEKYILEH